MGGSHRVASVLAIALTVIAFHVAASVAQEDTAAPIRDSDLGLAPGSVFDVLEPPVPATNAADPGDLPPVARAYDTAPPRVPHAVDDFLPITRSDNWCVDCHMTDWQSPEEGEPTPIPFSHYMDLRNESTDIGEEVVGSRWVCVSCHVPVTETQSLVANSFVRSLSDPNESGD